MVTIEHKKSRRARLCLIFMLSILIFLWSAASAAATQELRFPTGETNISINILINESEASGGVELGISCSSGLSVKGFSIDEKMLSAAKNISGQRDGINYYGFYAEKNVFQGQVTVGKLELTYNGNKEEKLTITELKTYRVDDHQHVIGTNKGPLEYTIKRSPDGTNGGNGSSGGGGRSSGSNSNAASILIGEDETPFARTAFFDLTGHWAEKDVLSAVEKGFVTGYPDGSFRPNAPVTRAEFVTMLVKANAMQKGDKDLAFSDAVNHWAQSSILIAASNGYISGYPDGTFRPNNNINRQEVAKIMADVKALNGADAPLPFFDTDQIDGWALPSVMQVYQAEIMQGDTNNNFSPLANTTRAEAMTIILRCIN